MKDIRTFSKSARPVMRGFPTTPSTRVHAEVPSGLIPAGCDVVSFSGKPEHLQFGANKKTPSLGLTSGWSKLSALAWDDLRRRDPDLDEFIDILDGKTTEDYLMDQIIHDQFQVGEGGDIIIDKPRIKIPNFRHGNSDGNGGGGQGTGKSGQGNGQGEDPGQDPKAGNGKGDLKTMPWQHKYGPSEVARIIGSKFGLPFLLPSDGESNRVRVTKENIKYVPPGDLHRKKTFRNALRHTVGGAVANGQDPDFNNITVNRSDKRYKAIDFEPQPNLKVAIIYMADVSGSITDQLRDFTRTANRFVSYPLKYKYGQLAAELAGEDYNDAQYFGKDGSGEGALKERFIVYTTEAQETSEADFYKVRQDGGTLCSSGFNKAMEFIRKDYPPSEGWNVYVYHFTDGDNWGDADNKVTVDIMKQMLNMGVRYIGHCDLGKKENEPSDFRKAVLKESSFKENPHVGSIGMPKKSKYDLDDYRKVVGTFLPANKEEPEWYDTAV
jgi:hypothetical protein